MGTPKQATRDFATRVVQAVALRKVREERGALFSGGAEYAAARSLEQTVHVQFCLRGHEHLAIGNCGRLEF